METLEKPVKRRHALAAALGVAAVLAALFPALAPIKPAANFITRFFSRPVKTALGTVFGLLPFSVMELEYIAALVFTVVYAVRTAVLAVRGEKKLRILARRTLLFLVIAAYLFVFFLWCFAIDYRSDSFARRSGMEAPPVEISDLYAVTKLFVRNASVYASDVRRDGGLHWAEDLDEILDKSEYIYENLSFEYPFLPAKSRIPKKMYLTSRLSSWMGFTGVYFPFSGESNINIDAPGPFIPETVCHELAHQKGVYSKQEANFVGIRAAIASGDPVYAYSGLLAGAVHLSNALYAVSPDLWWEIEPLMSEEMRTDWNDNNAYWKQFEGKVEEVSSKVYDGYLKAQGQEMGIRSYGACVDLLVEYYADMARTYAEAEVPPLFVPGAEGSADLDGGEAS